MSYFSKLNFYFGPLSVVCRYAIDAVILTAGLQILSGFSNYFWLLWLAVSHYYQLFYFAQSS